MNRAWRAVSAWANRPGGAWPLLLLPVLCQFADLSGWLSADPLYRMSGLSQVGWVGDGVLPGQPWIDGNAGGTLQALGGLVTSQWLSGTVPWWNHYSGVGLPLAGEMQPAAFFLPFILLLRLPHGFVLLKIVLQVLAGLSTWALLRRLRLGHPAALLGGALFQLNGTFAWFGDCPQLPVAFLPLLLLGIEQARARPGPAWTGFATVSIALAWSLFAGFPETAYLDGLLAAAWAMLRLLQGPDRLRLLLRLGAGVLVGVALAAPLLLAFTQLLVRAWLGPHGGDDAFLNPVNWAMLLFPHLLGAPLYGLVTGVSDAAYWWCMGGMLPVTLLLAAVLGAVALGPEQRLRAMLALWIALVVARAGGVPGAVAAFDAIPLVRNTLFFRYSAPSWELPVCVLAAFAFEARQSVSPRVVRLVLALCGLAAVAALAAAGSEVARLVAARPPAVFYPLLAVAWGGVGLALLAWGFARRARWVAVVLVVDAVGLFVLPTLAGTRDRTLHDGIVGYLRDNLGLQRAYGLGPVSPNYGAWFGVAMLNHLYLPVPMVWVDDIRARLDSGADPVTFSGTSPPPRDGQESRADAVRLRREAFAATGVSLILAPVGADPFRDVAEIHPPGRGVARPVSAAEPFSTTLPPALLRTDPLSALAIEAATYAGSADGQATLRLCRGETCRAAEVSLNGAQDNAMLTFRIDPPLPIGDEPVVATLGQLGGTHPFAVWLHAGAASMAATYVPSQPPPPRVYADGFVEAYALPHPATYFDTGGACDVQPIDWQAVQLRCPHPARLIRRELSYPGWRARIDDSAADLGTEAIFQALDVPQGTHTVRYRYAPPYVSLAWLAAALGIVALILSLLTEVIDARIVCRYHHIKR